MAIVRTNPLPPGLYWLDVWRPTPSSSATRDGEPAWLKWVGANVGRVVVLREEQRPEPLLGGPRSTFRVFRVTAEPTPFPFAELGFPAAHTNPELTSADTVQRPPPEPMFDFSLEQPIVVIGLLYLLSRR